MPLRCQVFILIGLISSSENNRSQLAKPPPRQHARSPFGQWNSPCKREKWHFPASASGAAQGCRHRAHAGHTDFPSPLVPRSISLCTLPWTCRPPLVLKLSLLSSMRGQKKKKKTQDCGDQHALKMKVSKNGLDNSACAAL